MPTFARSSMPIRQALFCAVFSLTQSIAMLAEEPSRQVGIDYFEREVRTLLIERCHECHGGTERKGGLGLDAKEAMLAGGDSGKALVPGEPDASLLIEAVRYRNPDLQMPPDNRLNQREVAVLEKWVAMGAPIPDSMTGDRAGSPMVGMSLEEGRRFWSFQPIGDPMLPEVKGSEWLQTPIDAFILSKLEEAGLNPAGPADKRTLIRRVTLDLTGIPPTAEEVQAFVEDSAEDAYRRLVERLLHSPRYGVRWGRHWLDVARYADSNGLDENLAFGSAWRYRDYVVDAFNRDKPFDQFLIEQVAGDLLSDDRMEAKVATGFLVLGAKVLAEPDFDKLMMDTIDEQLDTLGKVFWGMTLGCVRCHDHKFDPLKQSDYYALAAIFKSTRTFGDTKQGAIKHWHEWDLATQEEAKQIKEIEAEIAACKKKVADFKRQAINEARAAARAKGADYLAAAAQLSRDSSLFDAEALAGPSELNPHVLHQCVRYLAQRGADPFFATWREKKEQQDIEGIRDEYRERFERAEQAWRERKKSDPKASRLDHPEWEAARAQLYDNAGFLAIPSKPSFAMDRSTLDEYHRLSEEAWLLESRARDAPSVMGVADGLIQNSLPIHIRGSHRNLGTSVPRGFPSVMVRGEPPIFPRDESGRLELSQWMASPSHPLTARVYVNRIWRWHFGTGIVPSTENFGAMGTRPSHPELLDFLARYLIEANWSTKAVHRLILFSSTYQMASMDHAEPSSIDPENRLLQHFPRQRQDVEQLRDSLLSIAGLLDESIGGKTIGLRNRQFVFDHTSTDRTTYDSDRRALYLPVIRNHLYSLFERFDFPDPTMPTGDRSQTIVPSQALFMMNAPLVLRASDALASRIRDEHSDIGSRVERAYRLVLGRSASEQEQRLAEDFFRRAPSNRESEKRIDEPLLWSLYCQSLFASNEFLFIR